MKFKELLSRLSFLVSVPRCVCCQEKLDYEDQALCSACAEEYQATLSEDRCPECAELLFECSCPNKLLLKSHVRVLKKLFRYSPSKENKPHTSLIFALKRNNREDVISLCAYELASVIAPIIKEGREYLITNVPRRNRHILKYGYDHAELLSIKIGNILNIGHTAPLISKTKKAQKKLDYKSRISNVSYKIKKPVDLSGKYVILIDDIVTSGASMAVAADMLYSLGAKQVIGASLAISYR